MTREEIILSYIDETGYGLEIGPSYSPVAPKKNGYKVESIDYLSREQLIEKFTGHEVELDKIEDVDYIWDGTSYSELTGKTNYYDWIIASHVIEHTPDLIKFLLECDEILKENGIISLAVPDSRYCFDAFRPITGISKIIDAHNNHYKIHSSGTLIEYYLNVVSKGEKIAWDTDFLGEYRFIHTLQDAKTVKDSAKNSGTYIDAHAWCFTPNSFRLIIHDLFCLGYIPFREIAFKKVNSWEFFMAIGYQGKGPSISRMQMCKEVKLELSVNPDIAPQKKPSFWSRFFSANT